MTECNCNGPATCRMHGGEFWECTGSDCLCHGRTSEQKYTFEKDFVPCKDPYQKGYYEATNGKTLPITERNARKLIDICNFLGLELTDRINFDFPHRVCVKLGMKPDKKITN